MLCRETSQRTLRPASGSSLSRSSLRGFRRSPFAYWVRDPHLECVSSRPTQSRTDRLGSSRSAFRPPTTFGWCDSWWESELHADRWVPSQRAARSSRYYADLHLSSTGWELAELRNSTASARQRSNRSYETCETSEYYFDRASHGHVGHRAACRPRRCRLVRLFGDKGPAIFVRRSTTSALAAASRRCHQLRIRLFMSLRACTADA